MTETDRQTERLENILFLIVITFLAMAMRFFLFPIESGDYLQFLHPWYETLKENGGLLAIGMDIGDYMPPYFYILALLTYLPISDLFAIKMVSSAVDIVLAISRQIWQRTESAPRAAGWRRTASCCSFPPSF